MPVIFALLLLIAPLYIWRFSIGGLPTNFLMIFTFVVIVIAKFKIWQDHKYSFIESWKDYWQQIKQINKGVLWGIVLVSAASLVSLVAFGIDSQKLAQWIVLYFEPIVIFFLINYFAKKYTDENHNILRYVSLAAYILLGAAGALAIVQYLSLATLPPDWWGNANEPKRAIAFFAHPNAYGLFVTPLLAWLIPDVSKRLQQLFSAVREFGIWQAYKKQENYFLNKACVFAWLVGALGMFLSLSRGAWMGFVAAIGVYVLLSANKKMFMWATAALVALIILVAAVPNLRYRVILPFYGEKSAIARLSLWQTGSTMIKDNPLLGKGINGFSNNWDAYNKDANLEHYNFPHNILLNFWIDLGLAGVLGMVLIFASSIWQGIIKRKNAVALGLLLFLVALMVHGLIDIPYLKNDLALVFWLVLGLSL